MKAQVSINSRQLFKTSFLSGIASVVRIGLGFITNKVSSVYLGPAGYALLGQFTNFSLIAQLASTAGVPTGVTKYVAEHFDEPEKKVAIVRTAFWIALIASLVTALFILACARPLSIFLFHDPRYGVFLAAAGALIFFAAQNNLIASLLNGLKEIPRLIFVNIASVVLAALIYVPLVVKWSLTGAFVACLSMFPVNFALSLAMLLGAKKFPLRSVFGRPDFSGARKLAGYSLMTLVSALAAPACQIAVRSYLIRILSMDAAGYWQGVNRLSELYLSVITSALMIYYLPRLSEIKDERELREEVFLGYKVLMPIMLVMTVGIYVLKDFLIHAVYTEKFLPMRELFGSQLVGDFFRVASGILSFLILAKAKTRLFVFTETVFVSGYLLFAVFFAGRFGLAGAQMAYVTNHVLYFILMLVIFRKLLFARQVSNG